MYLSPFNMPVMLYIWLLYVIIFGSAPSCHLQPQLFFVAGVLSRVRIEWEEDSAVDIERACRAFTVQGFKGLRLDDAA